MVPVCVHAGASLSPFAFALVGRACLCFFLCFCRFKGLISILMYRRPPSHRVRSSAFSKCRSLPTFMPISHFGRLPSCGAPMSCGGARCFFCLRARLQTDGKNDWMSLVTLPVACFDRSCTVSAAFVSRGEMTRRINRLFGEKSTPPSARRWWTGFSAKMTRRTSSST